MTALEKAQDDVIEKQKESIELKASMITTLERAVIILAMIVLALGLIIRRLVIS
jgi:hypothetical protein